MITLTNEELNSLKIAANLHGIDIPYNADGTIDESFLIGARIGGLLGKAYEKTGDIGLINEALDKVKDVVGGDRKLNLRELDATGTKH